LLDPVARVGAEPRTDRRIKTLDGAQQAEVSLFDQVLERKPLADVTSRDVDHQSQVGPHHAVARQFVPVRDPVGQLLLLIRGQQSHLVDLPEIGLQGALDRVTAVSANTGHEDPRCVGQNRGRSSQG